MESGFIYFGHPYFIAGGLDSYGLVDDFFKLATDGFSLNIYLSFDWERGDDLRDYRP